MAIVRLARVEDRDRIAAMRTELWPDGSLSEHVTEAGALIATGRSGTLPAVILVAEAEDGALAGFLEVGLRSHADGCDPSRPVGFVEGWFVCAEHRDRGLGRELMRAAEQWAREQNCGEMASDALIENRASQSAHEAMGFEVVDRCVHFRKPI